MTSRVLKPCSNIAELLNLAIEVMLITRQMLFSHRAPRTAPGRATQQPKVRSGFSDLSPLQAFYHNSSSRLSAQSRALAALALEIWQSAPRSRAQVMLLHTANMA